MKDLHALRIFLDVARLGSFAEAARKRAMTPASATRAVAALEQDLGVQLLIRTTRQVSLTREGATFAAQIGGLVADLDAALDTMRMDPGDVRGALTLSVPVSFGLKVLPEILAGFRSQHPRVSLAVDMSDQFVDIVAGGFDLAVRISQPPNDRSTIWRKICRVARVLVAAPDTAEAVVSDPGDLSAERCLSYGPAADREVWRLSQDRARRIVRTGASLAANNGDLLAQMALQGAGVALLPRFIVADLLTAGALVEVCPDWQPEPLWLTLYYPPYTKLPQSVAAFSDHFEAAVQSGTLRRAGLEADIV